MSKVVDLSGFKRSLNSLLKGFPKAVDKGLDSVSKAGVKNAQATTLYKDRTTELRKNTKFIDNGNFSRTIIADRPYAKPVEFGRKAIVAKPGKALRFVINGQVLYRKSVKKAAPRPFMQNARAFMERIARTRMVRQVNTFLKGLKK